MILQGPWTARQRDDNMLTACFLRNFWEINRVPPPRAVVLDILIERQIRRLRSTLKRYG